MAQGLITRQNVHVRSANRLLVVFGGKQIGMLQNVSLMDEYAPEPASGIGDIHVIEYVPTMARHSLRVTAMMLLRGAMLEAGVVPENGDGMLAGLVFDIEVYSGDDGVLLRKYRGCSYASGSIEITRHAIVVQTGMFNALDVSSRAV
ncbi:MAG TPA: hypothetical protein VLH56_13310 [Dissulfurispiraceae bacterium]|nr:hypothetical protein [Dissulfurispiraceae bacterium]